MVNVMERRLGLGEMAAFASPSRADEKELNSFCGPIMAVLWRLP